MNERPLNRLKVVLVENQRTNKWLSEQLGVSAVTVSKWCSNIHQPSLTQLTEIASLLDIDVRTLICSNKQ
jgi:DNA-binding XRE family transcriptional regulator